jgi:plasmid stabilization system protein ParE
VRSAVFHPEAEDEFLAAARFYEQHAEGLGREFIAEVRHAVRRVVAHPESGARFARGLRRMLVDRFPYAILYRAEAEQILLVAMMHLHRRPGYWQRGL